jgi:pimeloyl-ACP methyl ester carboxylesterase
MASIAVGGTNVAYEVQGNGDPVILLHGSTGGRSHWMFAASALAEANQVVLVDYGGGGDTIDDGGPLEIDGLVDQVLGVADAESLDRFHIAGWSLGGVIAAATAATSPERVRSVALICAWAVSDAHLRFEFDLWQRLLTVDPSLFQRYLLHVGFTPEWFAATGDAVESVVDLGVTMLATGASRHAELDTRVDISERLGAITAPTLVIGGRRDHIVPFEHSEALAGSINDAEVVEFDCGHFVVFERADELATALNHFFSRH